MPKRKASTTSSSEYYSTSSSSSPPPKKKRGGRKASSRNNSRSTSKSAKSKKSKKKPKGYPKGAKSAYIFYTNEQRPAFKEKYPEAKFGELSKLMGAAWKELTDDKKKKYMKLNEEDKERFQKEKAKFEKEHPPGSSSSSSYEKSKSKKGGKNKRKKKKKGYPKGAKSAYIFYTSEQRPAFKEKYPDAKFGELSKLMGAAWKELTDEKKQKYMKMNEKDKERHKQEIKKYNEEHQDSSSSSSSEKPKKKKRVTKPKDPNAPKRPLNGYLLYCKDARASVKAEWDKMSESERTSETLTKELGNRWKNLPEGEKKKYSDAAAKAQEEYKIKNEAYKKKKEDEESKKNDSSEEYESDSE